MLSQIVKPGDRLELTKVSSSAISSENFSKNEKIKTYFSRIYDIIEEDKLKIAMPTEGTCLAVVGLNTKYEICMFTDSGLYRCRGTVVERYKENALSVAIIEIDTGIQKFQKRQHYHFGYHLELLCQILTEKEAELLIESNSSEDLSEFLSDRNSIKGITLELSGSGIRFVSDCVMEQGNYILCHFSVMIQGEEKPLSIVSRLIQSRKMPNRKNTYEYHVQFVNITNRDKEDLIRFIFEEERRYRKNKKG